MHVIYGGMLHSHVVHFSLVLSFSPWLSTRSPNLQVFSSSSQGSGSALGRSTASVFAAVYDVIINCKKLIYKY